MVIENKLKRCLRKSKPLHTGLARPEGLQTGEENSGILCRNVSEYSLEWHEHRTTMWQCECWGELDAYLFFLCVFGGIRMLPCMFLSITLCLFAFKLTPFLNSMIGVDGLEVVDMCWAAVRMYSGYSWRFLETCQCDVTLILLFTESTSSHTRAIVPCQDSGWSSVGAFESWTPFQQAVQNQRPFPGLS